MIRIICLILYENICDISVAKAVQYDTVLILGKYAENHCMKSSLRGYCQKKM